MSIKYGTLTFALAIHFSVTQLPYCLCNFHWS